MLQLSAATLKQGYGSPWAATLPGRQVDGVKANVPMKFGNGSLEPEPVTRASGQGSAAKGPLRYLASCSIVVSGIALVHFDPLSIHHIFFGQGHGAVLET